MPNDRAVTRFVRRPPSLIGLTVAAMTYGAALVPSLLPRPLMFLVVLTSLGTVGGYAVGSLLSWALHKIAWIREHQPRRWLAITIVALIWVPEIIATPIAITWQSEQQQELGMPEPLPSTITLVVLTIILSVLFVVIGRSLRLLTATIARQLTRIPWLSSVGIRGSRLIIAAGLVALALVGVSAGFNALVASYDTTNADMTGQTTDRVGNNSGGANSGLAWETLGRQGRAFVSNPMPVDAISAITGEPATEPLRLYVGMEQAQTADERSALAVKELDRSGAWDRKYLAIFVVTGTGWVDPNAANALEAVTGGDIATVAVQYSAVPSWIGFVIDPDTAQEQGASQVRTIVDAWRARPADARPELVLFGQSLGTFGSQAAWPQTATAEDVAADIGKVIWIGPPAQSRLWKQWQQTRTGGPAWQPIIGDGSLAKVYVTPNELTDAELATGPAITYAAHANDPVVYWSPDIFFNKPAWADQPLGPGVDPHFNWYPGISYLSVGFDLISGGEPPEVGHNYSANIGPAVALTLGVPGWTPAKTAALQAALPGLAYATD